MTYNPPIRTAARHGRSWLDRACPAPRWVGAVLAVALFGADAFQPIIGLVEVPAAARKAAPVQDSAADPPREAPQASMLCLQAWQWHPSNGELWPAFLFQPTINAGASGSVRPANLLMANRVTAALPPGPLAASQLSHAALCRPAAQVADVRLVQQGCCREIRPIGPPAA